MDTCEQCGDGRDAMQCGGCDRTYCDRCLDDHDCVSSHCECCRRDAGFDEDGLSVCGACGRRYCVCCIDNHSPCFFA